MADSFDIKVGIDKTEFEKGISSIESRIKRMRETGPSGTYSQLSQKYREQGDTQKAQRMEDYRSKAGGQSRRQLANDLRNQENLMKKNEMAQQKVTNSLEKTLKTQQNINRAKELSISLEQKHLDLAKSVNSIKDQMSDRGPGMGPFSGRDMDFMKRGFGTEKNRHWGRGIAGVGRTVMKNPMIMAGAAGMVGAAVGTGGQLAKQIMTYPERIAKREATTAGMLSEAARLQQQRRSYEMEYYSPERRAALEKAGTRVSAEKMSDKTGLFNNVLGGIAGGALAGGIAGAPFEALNIVPGLGALTHAGVTVAGGIAGGAMALGGSMFNDRKRSMVTGFLGSEKGKENYQKEMNAMYSDTYEDQLKTQKAKNPLKVMANEYFQKNAQKFVEMQRQFGLSDEDLWKGEKSIYSKAAGEGYDKDVMSNAMQRISAAGGTTAMGAYGGKVAAQMERNLDLTNAPELMGKVSGMTGGGVGESKDAIIRMQAEAMRIGLDTSEVRGFIQTSAEMAYKSGADTDLVSKLLSAGLSGGGLQSQRGVEAAANALENIKGKTSGTGGLKGQYELASLANLDLGIDKKTGKQRKGFNMGESSYIMNLPVTQVSVEDDAIQGFLLKRGIDPQGDEAKKIMAEIRKQKTESYMLRKERIERSKALSKSGKKRDAAQERMDKINKDEKSTPEQKKAAQNKFKAAQDEYTISMGEVLAASSLEGDFVETKEERLKKAKTEGELITTGGVSTKKEKEEQARIKNELWNKASTKSERLSDKLLSNKGMSDFGNLQILEDKTKLLGGAFDSVTTKTAAFIAAMDKIRELLIPVKDKSGMNPDQMLNKIQTDLGMKVGNSVEQYNSVDDASEPNMSKERR